MEGDVSMGVYKYRVMDKYGEVWKYRVIGKQGWGVVMEVGNVGSGVQRPCSPS